MSITNTIVETHYGKIQGTQQGSVYVWKGIPFAQPPVGPLRFLPPQSPLSWSDVRSAEKFGAIAAQSNDPMSNLFGGRTIPSSEDCLYLNIWSPGFHDDVKRPVMVWIHGGSFITGSGSTPWYDGTAFATNGDVVVVTINYRLGVFGFLHLADYGDEAYATSGNLGLLDQIAALRWVKENIAAFGGDPNKVTVFGESAGAMSIGTLLAMPAARGLFHAAILQSGASHTVASSKTASKIANNFLRILSIQDNPLQALRELSTEQLLVAQEELIKSTQGLAFRPVVDGTSLPQQPLEAVRSGSASDVAMLIGTNRDEMRLFTLMDASQGTLDEQTLEKLFGEKATTVIATYGAAKPEMSSSDIWNDILTDRTFRIPAIRLAEAQSGHTQNVWMYRFDWATPVFGGRLGACHALEIPFVWNNLDKPGVNFFTGEGPERQQVAEPMHDAWIAFAQTGNPNTTIVTQWETYTSERRATMIFNVEHHQEYDPQSAERRLWEGVL